MIVIPGLYEIVLTFHVLGAFAFFAGTIVAAVSLEVASRRNKCAEIVMLLQIARRAGFVVIASTVVTGAAGLWLPHLGHWGYGTPWVSASIALLIVVTLIGWAGGQRPKRARLLAGRLAEAGEPPTTELRALLRDRVSSVGNYLATTILVGIIILMVLKPS